MTDRILVIEDHPLTRDALTIILEQSGYDVIVANDGIEGVEVAGAERPDLIITDIKMPGLNGVEAIRRIRAHPDCGDVPILVVSGYHVQYAKVALEAGANRALAKPADPDVLLAAVRKLLKSKDQPQNI